MSTIGKNGRLGNQMFQFAALKGIARNRNFDYILPPSKDNNEYEEHRLLTLFEMKDVPVDTTTNTEIVRQLEFTFDEDLFNNCKDGIDLFGHFQTENFFAHIREELLRDFTFKNSDAMSVPEGDYVAIHVRRGDYLRHPNFHPACDSKYYKEAMSKFKQGTKFVVLSDDLEWCREQDFFAGCEFWQGTDLAHDMYVMTKAKHNIIANSTFSWWGAWLNDNPNKIVVAPQKWFGSEANHNTKDVIPDSWIKI
jgi:hypothetical protein